MVGSFVKWFTECGGCEKYTKEKLAADREANPEFYDAVDFASLLIPGGQAKNLHSIGKLAKSSSRILSWGKTAKGHLIKHADALGFGGYTPQQLQKMLPQLRGAANQLLNNANPALTRVGQWHDHQNAVMYISNGKMLVTEANGTFITAINKTANQWYNAAKPLQ